MKVIQVISEHKENHKRVRQQKEPSDWVWRTKVGNGECIVEIDGKKVTRHLPLLV